MLKATFSSKELRNILGYLEQKRISSKQDEQVKYDRKLKFSSLE